MPPTEFEPATPASEGLDPRTVQLIVSRYTVYALPAY
jgi:hypothetical protein